MVPRSGYVASPESHLARAHQQGPRCAPARGNKASEGSVREEATTEPPGLLTLKPRKVGEVT